MYVSNEFVHTEKLNIEIFVYVRNYTLWNSLILLRIIHCLEADWY